MKFSAIASFLREQRLLLPLLGVVILSLGCSHAQSFSNYSNRRPGSSRDFLELIRKRLELRSSLSGYPGIRNFRSLYQPANQWANRRPFYQQLLEEGGLSKEFGDELPRDMLSENNVKDEIQKRQELDVEGLSRRRKDAKHMINTIESLMHIGK